MGPLPKIFLATSPGARLKRSPRTKAKTHKDRDTDRALHLGQNEELSPQKKGKDTDTQTQTGYFTWCHIEQITKDNGKVNQCNGPKNLVQALGFTFDTIVFDCEGCYHHIVKENLQKFRNIKKIILE